MTEDAGTLLRWTRRGTSLLPVDETLDLMADGTIWLWVQVPADDERSDLVGTFQATATTDQLEVARQAAAGMSAGREAAAADEGTRHHPFVVVSGGSDSRTVSPGSSDDAGLLSLESALRSTALESPSQVARIGAAVTGDVAPGQDVVLGVVVASVGAADVVLRLDPAAFQVHWSGPGGPVAWAELPAPVSGLVDENAELFDGLLAPARLPPGSTGGLVVPARLPLEPVTGVSVRAAGTIMLGGARAGMPFPTEPFAARSRSWPIATG